MKTLCTLSMLAVFCAASSAFAAYHYIEGESTWSAANPPSPALANGDRIYIGNNGNDGVLNYDLDGTYTLNAIISNSTSVDGGTFNMTNGNLTLDYLWFADSRLGGGGMTADISGAGTSLSAKNVTLGGLANTNGVINVRNGASFASLQTGAVDLGNTAGTNFTLNISSGGGALFSGQLNLGSNGAGGKGIINMSGGQSSLVLQGTTYIGAYAKNGELNISGGTLSNDGATGRVGAMYVGFTSNGDFNVSGGNIYVNNLSVGNSLNSGGVNSNFRISGTANVDVVNLNIGGNTGNHATSQAVFESSSGAAVKVSTMRVNDSGSMVLYADKAGIDGVSKTADSMLNAVDIKISRSSAGLSDPISIDFSKMGAVSWLLEGDVVSIALFSFNSFSYNDVLFSKNALDFESFFNGLVVLKNNTGISGWEDVDFGDLYWNESLNAVSVDMTYNVNIPEPSAYAALLGGMALVFAAVRRR